MRSVAVILMVMSVGTHLQAEGGWQQCCTDHWLKRVNAPEGSSIPAQETICVAYTLPTGGIMVLPYGLDPEKLPRDEVIRDISKRYQAQVGAPLFIAANVPLDGDYSYDAALEGAVQTRSHLEWVEVLGTVPFAYDPNRFNDPPKRQLWDPQHKSDRAFHIAWQGMMRWPSGEGLTVRADNPEKKPCSAVRYQGTRLATLRFPVPDPQTWKKWNPGPSGRPGANNDTRPHP